MRGTRQKLLLQLAAALLAALPILLAARADVTAQDGSSPDGLVPPPAGTDIETLRKLLGLPSRAAQEAAPAAAAPAPAATEVE